MTTKHHTGDLGEVDRLPPRINVRLPDPEMCRQLEQAALAHSTTVSGYVRSLVLEALRKEKELSEYEDKAIFFG